MASKYDLYEPGIREFAIAYSKTDDKFIKIKLKGMIMKCVRIIDEQLPAARMSVKAKHLAEEKNIDLTKMTWINQPALDKGRECFVYEHKTPINMIAMDIINHPDDIISILESVETVWVTRDEDKELTKLGYWKNRPDSDLAYKEANIILV